MHTIDGDAGGYNWGTPPGGGGGGGHSGGAAIPYVFPCYNPVVNPFTYGSVSTNDAPVLTCPPPGSGLGWVAVLNPPPPQQDPCEVAQNAAKKMDTLFNKCSADSVLATIANLATETKEKGFPVYKKILISSVNPLDTTATFYTSGSVQTGTDTSITITSTTSNLRFLAGILHTHPAIGYSAHSPLDIYKLIEETLSSNHFQGSFVAAANGDQFALNVTDYAKASDFLSTKSQFLNGSKWDENSDIGKTFEKAEKYFQAVYKGNPNQKNLAYERAMAAVLTQFNTGITLSKKDATGNFKPIVMKTSQDPRKPKKTLYTQDCL